MHYSVAIPYRGRPNNLRAVLEHLETWLPAQRYMDSYNVTVVEQGDDKLFNLGWCINVGFALARSREHRCSVCNPNQHEKPFRFVFQPADCLPLSKPQLTQGTPAELRVDVPDTAWADVEFGTYECPANTAVLLQPRWWQPWRAEEMQGPWTAGHWAQFGTYYKALVFDPAVYVGINGHPNEYFGWGREDDELLYRLELHREQIHLEHRPVVFDELANESPRQSAIDPRAWTPADHVENDGLSNLTFEVVNWGRLQVGTLRVSTVKVIRP